MMAPAIRKPRKRRYPLWGNEWCAWCAREMPIEKRTARHCSPRCKRKAQADRGK